MKFTIPFFSVIRPLSNARMNRHAHAAEVRKVRDLVLAGWPPLWRGLLVGVRVPPEKNGWHPIVVDFVRYSTGTLDDDNLLHAFKPARDEAARCLGLKSDAHTSVLWTYQQRPASPSGCPKWCLTVSLDWDADFKPHPLRPRSFSRTRPSALAARAKPNTHPPRTKAKP